MVEGVYALLEWQTALNECEAAFAGADDLGRRVAAVVAPDPDCELPPDTAPRFAESGPRPTGFARSSDLRRWPIGVPSRRALPPPPAARRRSTGGSRPRRRPPSRRALRQGESDLRAQCPMRPGAPALHRRGAAAPPAPLAPTCNGDCRANAEPVFVDRAIPSSSVSAAAPPRPTTGELRQWDAASRCLG